MLLRRPWLAATELSRAGAMRCRFYRQACMARAGQPILRSRCLRRDASSSSGAADRLAAVGALAGEVGDRAGQLAHRAGNGDAEHALATLQQVDDFLGRRALVDGGAVGEQRDVGQIANTALAQMVDGDADVVQRDAGVQQSLDDLEDEDVLERVQPLAAGPGGAADRRHDQRGPGPVVQLAVGDAGDLAGARPAVADQLVGHRVVGEQPGLHGFAGSRCPTAAARHRSRKVQLLLTWRVSHSRILSPIELASVTCTAARLPKPECVEHTLPDEP